VIERVPDPGAGGVALEGAQLAHAPAVEGQLDDAILVTDQADSPRLVQRSRRYVI